MKSLSEQFKGIAVEPKETLSQAYQRIFVDGQPRQKAFLEELNLDRHQTSFLEKLLNHPK